MNIRETIKSTKPKTVNDLVREFSNTNYEDSFLANAIFCKIHKDFPSSLSEQLLELIETFQVYENKKKEYLNKELNTEGCILFKNTIDMLFIKIRALFAESARNKKCCTIQNCLINAGFRDVAKSIDKILESQKLNSILTLMTEFFCESKCDDFYLVYSMLLNSDTDNFNEFNVHLGKLNGFKNLIKTITDKSIAHHESCDKETSDFTYERVDFFCK